MNTMRELKEELKKTSAGRVFLEEAEQEKHTNKLIEFAKDHDKMIGFAKEQCEIFPEDSYMGKYLRETIKILQAEPCEDAISREDVKAIPIDQLKQFKNEVMNMNSIAIIQRLDKLIEEVEDEIQ